MARRSTFTDQSVTYGAIGATIDPDLLRYPPPGFSAAEDSVRLGSGRDRFEQSAESLMTWGIQQGAGFTVTDAAPGTGAQYTGISYDATGTPLPEQPATRTEQKFAADGTPYLSAGMTATLRRRRRSTPVLVVYLIDEPNRVGFAIGTAGPSREHGEESFVLEHRDDDSVWLTIRSAFEPHGRMGRLLAPVLRRRRRELTTRELRALHPAFTS
ncbi:DUF1990 family protein [Agromyces marinus]|uniref:DUF1990 domain-containing protein n=1 Tax=Agromyces marinus TaxID=1389020 RepID=A0ABM8GXP2_9MICO|nr:DUF1990 family protein [Agromyces marinus]UIP58472.1 hypothetical protein DSM26151_13470 [Agromyces marinus]BDZ53264.1 hypothetical protein GCM10025870_03370 [Agromyces marinus]